MRTFVGVTDWDWYQFLRVRPDLNEVNFWRPSGLGFRALSTGEPFLFKTHQPHNALVGGGFLSSSTALRLSEAWRFFGESNGAATIDEMRAAIAGYRRRPLAPEEDPEIGCVLLRDVFFVPPDLAVPAPSDFAGNIVVGKTYDLAESSYLESALEMLLAGAAVVSEVPGAVFGDPRLSPRRLGQRAFKALVMTAYGRRCAITGGRIGPVLEAAHIRPVSDQGENRLDNGLLLRSDVHTLFDAGYLGIDPAHRTLQVSPRIRADFGNGDEFYARQGQPLVIVPQKRLDRPGRDFLEWHMDEKFLATA